MIVVEWMTSVARPSTMLVAPWMVEDSIIWRLVAPAVGTSAQTARSVALRATPVNRILSPVMETAGPLLTPEVFAMPRFETVTFDPVIPRVGVAVGFVSVTSEDPVPPPMIVTFERAIVVVPV